jgi:adenylate kinase
LVIDAVERKLNESKETNLVLDGVPRTLIQAKLLDNLTKIDAIVDIRCREDVIIERLSGRRLCPQCDNGYNYCDIQRDGYDVKPLNPKKDKLKCDDCNVPLVQREDDTVEVIKDRMKTYKLHTAPILDYYESQDNLIWFDPKKGKADYPVVKEGFFNFLRKKGILN